MQGKHDLPRWVWHTAMFLYHADKARSSQPERPFGEVYQEFLQEQGLDSSPQGGFQLRNQGLTLMLAYGLLVLPRGLWRREDLSTFQFKTRDQFTFIIDQVGAQSRPAQFIRCMRNAIAHANVSVIVPAPADQKDAFTLWNTSGQGRMNFKVTTSWLGLSMFLDEIGKYYINVVRPTLSDHD